MNYDTKIEVWEVYERDGPGCVACLSEDKARAYDGYENGYDRVSRTIIRVSGEQYGRLVDGEFIYL